MFSSDHDNPASTNSGANIGAAAAAPAPDAENAVKDSHHAQAPSGTGTHEHKSEASEMKPDGGAAASTYDPTAAHRDGAHGNDGSTKHSEPAAAVPQADGDSGIGAADKQ